MIKVKDPRTGQDAYINDRVAYSDDLGRALQACEHSKRELRRWTNANGALAIQEQCLECEHRQGNPVKVTDRTLFAEASVELRDEWRLDRKRAIEAINVRHIDLTASGEDELTKSYNAYLASNKWRLKREKVVSRCGGICEGCAESRATQVHHLTYRHFGDELLFELVGLCEECHERAHRLDEDEQKDAAAEEAEIDF